MKKILAFFVSFKNFFLKTIPIKNIEHKNIQFKLDISTSLALLSLLFFFFSTILIVYRVETPQRGVVIGKAPNGKTYKLPTKTYPNMPPEKGVIFVENVVRNIFNVNSQDIDKKILKNRKFFSNSGWENFIKVYKDGVYNDVVTKRYISSVIFTKNPILTQYSVKTNPMTLRYEGEIVVRYRGATMKRVIDDNRKIGVTISYSPDYTKNPAGIEILELYIR